jgi:hypothetical protein
MAYPYRLSGVAATDSSPKTREKPAFAGLVVIGGVF